MKTTAIRVGSAIAGLATLGSMLFIAAPAFASYNAYPTNYGSNYPQQEQTSGPCTNRFSTTCIAQTWSWLDTQFNSYSNQNSNQYQNENSYNNYDNNTGYNSYPTYSDSNYGNQYDNNDYGYNSYPSNSYSNYDSSYGNDYDYDNQYNDQYDNNDDQYGYQNNQYENQYSSNYPKYEYQDQYVATPSYSAYNYNYNYSY
jgi:hypothetical protein